ncbi:MAG: response regulator [Candidatus Kariarchaeaceae archaeon]
MEILCVDDEEGLLTLTKLHLERSNPNFNITTCLSAKEGLQLLESKYFDVIVSDYQMSEMDGIAFLKNLRSKGSRIPFIIFTGRGKEEVAVEALNIGANRYIQKKGSPNALYEVLSRAIQDEYEHWKVQQELMISENKFRTLIDTMIVGIATTDNNRIIAYVNNELCNMLNYSKDEIIGRKSIDMFNEENKKILENYRVHGKGRRDPYEIEWTGKGGKQVKTRITPFRIVNSEKVFDGTVAIIVDITKEKKREKEISDTLIELEQIFQMANAGMIVINKNFTINKVNRSFMDLSGITGTINLEKHCYDQFKLSICNTPRCNLNRIINGEKEVVIIEEVEFSSGKKIKCKITARPLLDSDGKLIDIVERFECLT